MQRLHCNLVKAIIFDLDGTLVNSLEDLSDACNYALKTLGFPVHETEKYRYFVGDGIMRLIDKILPPGTPDAQRVRAKDLFDEYYAVHCMDNTKPYTGITEVVRIIKERRLLTAVVSNKPMAFAKHITGSLFCGECAMDVVLGQSGDIPKKPDPAGVKKAAALLGVPLEQCIYCGDSNVDVITAKNAKIPCIGAVWGFRGETELKQNDPAFLAYTPEDILKVL